MLPSYDKCFRQIQKYKNLPPNPYKQGFKGFWDYKQKVESKGYNILDGEHLEQTAKNLHQFLIDYGMARTGIASVNKIKQILRNIKPYYDQIQGIELGKGQIPIYREPIKIVYDKLGGVTNNIDDTGNESSITGKSKTLLAIWGQIPGFDSLNRIRFTKWTHLPEPLLLPHLRKTEIWYKPDEFCDMIEELDRWVLKWTDNNNGKVFANSFSDLYNNIPVGRLIDMIYNWKLPDN